jgi:hypothetical protein
VKHYAEPGLDVRYWEFYNEPDNGNEGCAPPPTECGWWGHFPDEYAQMLATVYPAAKAARADVQVVFGGLAYDRWDTGVPPGPFVESFLTDVLAAGAGASFDAMNFHYYPGFAGKWDPYGLGITGKAAYIRNKMAEFGLVKPVICTETGMWSDPLHGPPYGSDEVQSRYVPQVYSRAAAAHLDITIWFMLIDPPGPYDWKFGLVKADGDLTPKPAHRAYQVVAQQLPGATYLRTLRGSSPDVEAYEFVRAGGSGRVAVAWSNSEGSYEVVLPGSQIEVLDMYGASTVLYDGDGDGMVHVPLGLNPVYARY